MTTNDMLRVTDSRTGRSYELPIVDGAIRAIDLRQIKTSDDDFGLLSYDPAFQNTASCRSAITFIDGDRGILRYRGYPIEELAERSTFLETAYLLLYGELPTPGDRAAFIAKCHSLGLRIDFWTIDDKDEAARLLALGADGIMTNDPATIRPLFHA